MAAVEVARNFAQITTAIWSDPDFRSRTPNAQRLYLFLISQPDLSLVGVLHVRVGPWARAGEGLTRDDVVAALDELDRADLIAWDRDEAEVWVRAFIRRNVLSVKTYIGASRAFGAVASPLLASRILAEINPAIRQSFAEGFEGVPFKVLADRIAEMPPWRGPPKLPADGVSDGVSDGVFPQRTDTGYQRSDTGEEEHAQAESNSDPPLTGLAPATPGPSEPHGHKYTQAFQRWWEEYPRKTAKLDASRKYEVARRAVGEDLLLIAAQAWSAYWLATETEMRFIPYPATFLHQGQYESRPPATTALDTRSEKQRKRDAFWAEQMGPQAAAIDASAVETYAIETATREDPV